MKEPLWQSVERSLLFKSLDMMLSNLGEFRSMYFYSVMDMGADEYGGVPLPHLSYGRQKGHTTALLWWLMKNPQQMAHVYAPSPLALDYTWQTAVQLCDSIGTDVMNTMEDSRHLGFFSINGHTISAPFYAEKIAYSELISPMLVIMDSVANTKFLTNYERHQTTVPIRIN